CACLRDEHWTLEKVPQENQLAYHAYHYRGPAGSVIDLHWHATFFWRRTDFDQALWTNSVTVQIGNLTLNVLSPEDMFFHACIHGNYALGYEWHWMLDAALILGKCGGHLHWDRICELAEQSRTILVLQKAFAYLETHLDIEIPQESKALLARSRLAITERFDAYAQRSAWVPGRRLAALLSSYWRTSGPDSGSAPVMPFIDYLRFRWGLSESSSLMASILRRIVKPVPVANE
ncbi:MAG TPA: nucleotidyltransferase family protein, partial [Oligoflexia bacterium]|nr:nucleotidyltransferase family protein [Oligoflexia bacterium]